METINLQALAVVRTTALDSPETDWNKVESEIHIAPEFAAGLKGLEDWSHIIVIFLMHETTFENEQLLRRPQGRADMPEVGVFAHRSRQRPNQIGITTVRILGIEEGLIRVRGLDARDGTPVLDIKPYAPVYDGALDPLIPAWFLRLMQGRR